MTSSANLIRALNRRNKKLNELFDLGETQQKICRKLLWVTTTDDEKREWDENIENKNYEIRTFRKCTICNLRCKRSKLKMGTCSNECYQKKLSKRNQAVSDSHWCKSDNADEIQKRRIQTRQENDVLLDRHYVPWNKGKHDIYSDETISKISNASIKQFSEKKIRQTKPEKAYEQILKSICVEYTYSYIFHRRQLDFYLPAIKTFVEIQGDFWHGNPKKWGTIERPFREHQKMKRLDDRVKKCLVERHGFRYVEFWENDVYNNVNMIIEETKRLFNSD